MKKKNKNQAIKKAISIIGSQKKLAEVCGKTQTTVWKWANGEIEVNPVFVPLIVNATNGQVKAWEIRPDCPLLFPKD